MMSTVQAKSLRHALAAGSERLSAWADLLDRINVFPVADGDTGRNLVISLHPLKDKSRSTGNLVESLLMSARGNSGNIAVEFFHGFLTNSPEEDLPRAVKSGRDLAWSAVNNPLPGTMLSLFDALAEWLELSQAQVADEKQVDSLLDHLEQTVCDTTKELEALKAAGVVDSGALGMFIFFEAFISHLHNRPNLQKKIPERFNGLLSIQDGFAGSVETGFCVDASVRTDEMNSLVSELESMGESVVTMKMGDTLKVHLHTDHIEQLRSHLEAKGRILNFSSDNMEDQTRDFTSARRQQAIHVMTDAAGSVTRSDSRRLGMTILDSYVNIGLRSFPETHMNPMELYESMRQGAAVSTSQASVYERHQHFHKAMAMHERVLYLPVGSVFTGNFQTAQQWKKENDPQDKFKVFDTHAASGKLALIALECAEQTLLQKDPVEIMNLAKRAIAQCDEWIFLDQLKWLAAGGRLSRSSAFFGDLLHMKPVVSPTAEGAKKVAVVRNQQAQLDFAIERLREKSTRDGPGKILLQYTDNQQWINEKVLPQMTQEMKGCNILTHPMSLTSGAHMGPGTWAVAFLPEM